MTTKQWAERCWILVSIIGVLCTVASVAAVCHFDYWYGNGPWLPLAITASSIMAIWGLVEASNQ